MVAVMVMLAIMLMATMVDDIDHKNRKIYMTLPDGLLALGE